MKVKREWSDEQEVFEMVASALEQMADKMMDVESSDSAVRVSAFDERGCYGDQGTITITIDGRKFALDLHEII
jgi:hypothetical protein